MEAPTFAVRNTSSTDKFHQILVFARALVVVASMCVSSVALAGGILNPGSQVSAQGYYTQYTDPVKGNWQVNNAAGVSIATGTPGTANNGWDVWYSASTQYLTVLSPSGIAAGDYYVEYTTGTTTIANEIVDVGYTATFTAPPTLPGPRAGSAYSFEASVGGVNLINGNKLTSVPIVVWTAKDGMKVGITLSHSSQSTRVSTLGYKWIQTYDAYITPINSSSYTLYWGDETNYTIAQDKSSYYVPAGQHDQIVSNSDGSLTDTTLDQVQYHFSHVTGLPSGNWYLDKITDESGYAITIHRTSAGLIDTITDPTGRTLTLAYDSNNRIHTVTDPLSRVWTLNFDGSNNLYRIDLPPVNGVNYSEGFSYDSNHNIQYTTDPNGHTSGPMSYNSSDNSIAYATDAMNNRVNFSYSTSPAKTTVTDPNNNATVYNLGVSRLVSEVDPLGKTAYFYYDSDDNVSSGTDKRGYTWSSVFDSRANKTSNTDQNSNTTSATYSNTNKLLTSVVTPSSTIGALTTSYTYGAGKDLLTQVSDPLHNATNYAYYPSGDSRQFLLETVTDPLSHATNYDYDSNGYVNKVTDALNNSTTSNRNSLGWVMSTTDPLNHSTSYTYDNWGRVVSVTAPDGTISRTWYDADSNVVAASDADALVGNVVGNGVYWSSTSEQASFGSSIGFNGTSGSYIDTGAQPTPAVDTSQSFSVAAWVNTNVASGKIICSQAGANVDGFRFVVNGGNAAFFGLFSSDSTSATLTQINSSTLNLNQWYHLTGVFDSRAMTLSLYVNGSLVSSQSLPAGWTPWRATGHFLIGSGIGGTYPWSGQVDELKLYNRALTSSEVSALYNYNPNMNVNTRVSDGLSHHFAFSEGSGSQTYDSCHTTFYGYDADNRVFWTENGRGDQVFYSYDGSDPRGNGRTQRGLLSSKTDGNGHVTYYGYTVRSEPEYTRYPDNATETVAYDANGNKTSHTDANGNTISYIYDHANRLTNVNYPASPLAGIAVTNNVTFGYDGANRRTSMTDGQSGNGSTGATSTTWSYDGDSRVQGFTTPSYSLGYTYDNAGRLTNKTYGSTAWVYGYDNDNRISSAQVSGQPAATTFTYNPDGTLATKKLSSGMQSVYSYDTAAELTLIQTNNTSGVRVAYTAYNYDSAGNQYGRADWTLTPGNNGDNSGESYWFDGADQLTEETRYDTSNPDLYQYNFTYRYGYDHNGNRTYKNWGNGTVDNYTYDNHDKLTGAGAYTFGYNANGDMTAVYNAGALLWSYGYDCEDRLASYSNAQSTGLHGDNEYTGLGGRYVLHDSTGGRWQFNDGQSATSTLLTDGIKNYNPGLGEYSPWAGAYYDYNSDSLGSVVGLLAPNQTEQEGYSFDAFGNSARTEGSTAFPQGQVDQFAAAVGYQTDNDTGLVRCGNRYYNPYFGRFITQDPVGDGDNWYAYCDNDPTGELDPDGLAMSGTGGAGGSEGTDGGLYTLGVSSIYNILPPEVVTTTTNYTAQEIVRGEVIDTINMGTVTVTEPFTPEMMEPMFFAQRGRQHSVGQTGATQESLRQALREANIAANQRGLTPQERAARHKIATEIGLKLKAQEKEDNDRRSRQPSKVTPLDYSILIGPQDLSQTLSGDIFSPVNSSVISNSTAVSIGPYLMIGILIVAL